MKRIKLMTIVGTRPELIKMSEIVKKCDQYFEHILVHTGQNYDYALSEIFFKDLALREPDIWLNVSGNNLGETIGNVITKSYNIILEHNPDSILILGDTNSCLCALSAKRLKVPIFHMEAGNRCFDENVPEEINRRIVDHISDVNMCYTEHARRNLYNEGISQERTFVVGSPMKEVLDKNIKKINDSTVLKSLGIIKEKYILLSAHREENIDNEDNFLSLMNAVNDMGQKYNMPIIYSVHPRSKKYIEKREFKFRQNVKIIDPFGFIDYNKLQASSYCVVSDSGTLAEEATYFQFPAVSIRTSTERPEALDKGNFIIGGISKINILQGVDMAVAMKNRDQIGTVVPDYTDNNVSMKIVRLIQSYKHIIDKYVWRKK